MNRVLQSKYKSNGEIGLNAKKRYEWVSFLKKRLDQTVLFYNESKLQHIEMTSYHEMKNHHISKMELEGKILVTIENPNYEAAQSMSPLLF